MMCVMNYPTGALRRVAEAVRARRAQLGLSVDECSRRARMSNTTWHRVEDALGVRDTTYARVDEVLDWPAESCVRILDDPAYEPFPSETVGGARHSRPPIVEAAVRQAVQSATIATAPDLTGAQITALQERVIEELRRQGLIPASNRD